MYIPNGLKNAIERNSPRVYDDPDFILALNRRLDKAISVYTSKKRGTTHDTK